MFLLYHAYIYLELLILTCTIYILAPKEEKERDDQSNTALTILSVLCFFSAMIDGNDYLSTLDWLIPAGVLDIILKGVFPITMIGILLYVLKKLYGRSK